MSKEDVKARVKVAYESAIAFLDTYKGSVGFAAGLVAGFVFGFWIG